MHVYGLWITFFHRHKYIGNRKTFIGFEMGFMGRCALDNWTWTHTPSSACWEIIVDMCVAHLKSQVNSNTRERGDVTSASDDVGVGKGDRQYIESIGKISINAGDRQTDLQRAV